MAWFRKVLIKSINFFHGFPDFETTHWHITFNGKKIGYNPWSLKDLWDEISQWWSLKAGDSWSMVGKCLVILSASFRTLIWPFESRTRLKSECTRSFTEILIHRGQNLHFQPVGSTWVKGNLSCFKEGQKQKQRQPCSFSTATGRFATVGKRVYSCSHGLWPALRSKRCDSAWIGSRDRKSHGNLPPNLGLRGTCSHQVLEKNDVGRAN